MRITLLLVLAMFAGSLSAQVVTYEGDQPPGDLFGPVTTTAPVTSTPAGQLPVVDVDMDQTPNHPPALQRAHNGLYQDSLGSGAQIDYRHLINGSAIVKVLLPDGTYGEGFGLVTGTQALFDLYADGILIGEVKIGSTTVGSPCGRLKARARFGADLLFPLNEPNPTGCLPTALAQGSTPPPQPYSYCRVALFGEKLGEVGAGPETCQQ